VSPDAPMSAEIESLTVESAARRTGGASPTTVALAGLALLLAAAAHWRFNRFDDRVDGVRNQLVELRELQKRSSERLDGLASMLEATNAAWRNELTGLRAVRAQMAELGSAVEELSARTEAPQRAWARAEALYLLELAERRIELERDVRTAIVAMESADARLSTISDPAVADVRRQLALELDALRAVPAPDLPQVLARILAVERAASKLPVRGVSTTAGVRGEAPATPRSGLSRLWHRLRQATRDLFSLRRVDGGIAPLVTEEAESLRRQHLGLLLLGARVAAVQQDGAAYRQALLAAGDWLSQNFDLSGPEAERIREEIDALAAIDVDPPRPATGAAARSLRRIIQGGTAAP
jgi:uroporphyrin-III C-methyltransferase